MRALGLSARPRAATRPGPAPAPAPAPARPPARRLPPRPAAAGPAGSADDEDDDATEGRLPIIPPGDPTARLLDASLDPAPPPPKPPGRVLKSLPLFPLNLVAFPGADVPLHIFEARYRVLFNTLLDGADECVVREVEERERER